MDQAQATNLLPLLTLLLERLCEIEWPQGMATPHHTPQGRGYDSSLNYFSHANWMHSQHEWLGSYDHRADVPVEEGFVDLWDTDRPASHLNGSAYEEYIFRDRIQNILQTHDQTKPLFLQYDSKIAHYPMQAPQEYQEQFAFIKEDHRRMYHAMVAFLDDQLLNITSTMKQLDMWDNTLMVAARRTAHRSDSACLSQCYCLPLAQCYCLPLAQYHCLPLTVPLSVSYPICLYLTRTAFLTITLPLLYCLPISHAASISHTLPLTLPLSLSHCLSHYLSLSLTASHTTSISLSLPLTLPLSLSHCLYLSHTACN